MPFPGFAVEGMEVLADELEHQGAISHLHQDAAGPAPSWRKIRKTLKTRQSDAPLSLPDGALGPGRPSGPSPNKSTNQPDGITVKRVPRRPVESHRVTMFRPKSTFEQWRIFQAVVDCGGYAPGCRGAEQEPILPQSCGCQLQQSLGVALLEVRGRRRCWTPAGRSSQAGAQLSQQVEELENLNPGAAVGAADQPLCVRGGSRRERLPGAGPLLLADPCTSRIHCHLGRSDVAGSHRPAAGLSAS